MKISIIGIGRIGSLLAYSLVPNPKIDQILLFDTVKERVEGTILDISHAFPNSYSKLKEGDHSDMADSDIIVVIAGKPRTPDITRMGLFGANRNVIEELFSSIKPSKNSIIVILTNPVEPLAYLAYRISGLEWKRVIGFSNVLDTERLRVILSRELKIPAEKIDTLVIGEHGENMIPVFSQTIVDGKNLSSFNLNLEKITLQLKKAAAKIIKTAGATQFGPISHLVRFIDGIINDRHETFPVSFYLEKECYGIKDVCISLPVKIGRNGIEEVVSKPLSPEEKSKLKNVAKSIKTVLKKSGLTQPEE